MKPGSFYQRILDHDLGSIAHKILPQYLDVTKTITLELPDEEPSPEILPDDKPSPKTLPDVPNPAADLVSDMKNLKIEITDAADESADESVQPDEVFEVDAKDSQENSQENSDEDSEDESEDEDEDEDDEDDTGSFIDESDDEWPVKVVDGVTYDFNESDRLLVDQKSGIQIGYLDDDDKMLYTWATGRPCTKATCCFLLLSRTARTAALLEIIETIFCHPYFYLFLFTFIFFIQHFIFCRKLTHIICNF